MNNIFKYILFCSIILMINQHILKSSSITNDNLISLREALNYCKECLASDKTIGQEAAENCISLFNDFLLGNASAEHLSQYSYALFLNHRCGHILLYDCVYKNNTDLAGKIMEKISSIHHGAILQRIKEEIRIENNKPIFSNQAIKLTFPGYCSKYPYFSLSLDDQKIEHFKKMNTLIDSFLNNQN